MTALRKIPLTHSTDHRPPEYAACFRKAARGSHVPIVQPFSVFSVTLPKKPIFSSRDNYTGYVGSPHLVAGVGALKGTKRAVSGSQMNTVTKLHIYSLYIKRALPFLLRFVYTVAYFVYIEL